MGVIDNTNNLSGRRWTRIVDHWDLEINNYCDFPLF